MKMMGFIRVAMSALLLGSQASAQFKVLERTHTVDGHTALVRMEIRRFEPKQHTVRPFHPTGHSGEPCVEIDGVTEPLGTDCEAPTTEILTLNVTLDRTRLTIPRELYRDCYNPLPDSSIAVRLADDHKGVFVFFGGSDGAGSYQVLWVFRVDGRHSRISCVPSECSGGGFLNLRSGDHSRVLFAPRGQ